MLGDLDGLGPRAPSLNNTYKSLAEKVSGVEKDTLPALQHCSGMPLINFSGFQYVLHVYIIGECCAVGETGKQLQTYGNDGESTQGKTHYYNNYFDGPFTIEQSAKLCLCVVFLSISAA